MMVVDQRRAQAEVQILLQRPSKVQLRLLTAWPYVGYHCHSHYEYEYDVAHLDFCGGSDGDDGDDGGGG